MSDRSVHTTLRLGTIRAGDEQTLEGRLGGVDGRSLGVGCRDEHRGSIRPPASQRRAQLSEEDHRRRVGKLAVLRMRGPWAQTGS